MAHYTISNRISCLLIFLSVGIWYNPWCHVSKQDVQDLQQKYRPITSKIHQYISLYTWGTFYPCVHQTHLKCLLLKSSFFCFIWPLKPVPFEVPFVSDNWICWSWVNPGPKIQNHKWCLFSSVFVSSFCSFCGMETAIRFAILARLDLPFYEYAGEFCKLAVATTEDDATFNHLFWLGANFYRSVDLPDAMGLSWKEGSFRCLGSIRARARAIPPSSLPAVPVASPLAPAPEFLDTALSLEFSVSILPAEPAPRQCPQVPAPRQRPQVPAPPERPQVPAPPECPPVPAPPERPPQESVLPECPQ